MSEFHKTLREEILQAQNRRADLIKYKFSFVISALGLGSLTFSFANTSPLLFCVPVIALAYDLYILGEDFGIKRAGAFLGRDKSEVTKEEKVWELFVVDNRDKFSVIASPILSLVATIGAGLVYAMQKSGIYGIDSNKGAEEVCLTAPMGEWWYVFIGALIIILAVYALCRNRRVRLAADKLPK